MSLVETTNCTLCGEAGNSPYRFEEYALPDGPTKLGHNRCTSCGLRYVSPRLNAEGLSYLYNERYDSDTVSGRYNVDDEVSGNEYESFEGFIRSASPGGGRFLDVGCGVGMLLERFRNDEKFIFDGVEFSEHAARQAADRANAIYVGELADHALPSDHYDGVACLYVLEHVPNPVEVLEEIFRVTRPGGHVFAAVPNYRYLRLRSDNRLVLALKKEATLHAAEHLQNFTPETFQDAVQRVGFEVSQVCFAKPLNVGSPIMRAFKTVASAPADLLARVGYGLGGIQLVARKPV